ncbi:MAG: peptidase C11 [Lachnospiraceae bacterium]|nr:peptidase C11 [Lachnospiraceae bacterium]
MDPSRDKHVTDNSKGVHKRGDGLNLGRPVGRSDGYSGRGGSSGRGPEGGGGGFSKLIIALIVLVLGGGGGGLAALMGGGSDEDVAPVSSTQTPGQSTGNHTAYSGATISSTDLSSIMGLFGGGMQGAQVSNGWTSEKNTGKLDNTVVAGARAKRCAIKGDGKDKITIMIYTCGTDLESRSGMASNDIREMCNASLSDNINILLYTGGCKEWKTKGISKSVNQIYKITNGNLERLVDDDGDKTMTNPSTLSAFIKWCNKNYPADRNELIFWDHGGGSITGYGYDEKHSHDGSMSLGGINRALNEAGVTFDFIGFDACLMATYETAVMVSSYADYLIASEETEPGIGWYYTDWLNELSKNTSMPTLEIGKNIVDGFVNECDKRCPGQKTTLSVIDLCELTATVPEKLNAFAATTAGIMQSDDYKSVADARAGTREFATSSRIDQIDLVNFADKVGTDEAKALKTALLGAVKYNNTSSSMTDAYGISIYLPYRGKNKGQVNSAVSSYSDIGMDAEYGKLVKSFAGVQATGQLSMGGQGSAIGSLFGGGSTDITSGSDAIGTLLNAFLSGGRSIPGMDSNDYTFMKDNDALDIDKAAEIVSKNQFDPSYLNWTTDENGVHLMTIPNKQWELIESLQVNMFYDDGEGYIDMGLDNLYSFTENAELIGDTDNTWLAIDGQPVAYYYENTVIEDGKKTITGRVPVMLDGVLANLIITFDEKHPKGYIAGARYDYRNGETEAVAKGVTEIAEGTKMDFICDYYGYDQSFKNIYYLGEQMEYKEGLEISNVDVKGKTKITYLLTDIYGREYWTPAIDQQ